jgi:hypothetical protein
MSMEKGIEEVAGYVEDYLEWAEESRIQDVIDEIDVPQPAVLMGVGYLASQGKVDFDDEQNVSLS